MEFRDVGTIMTAYSSAEVFNEAFFYKLKDQVKDMVSLRDSFIAKQST